MLKKIILLLFVCVSLQLSFAQTSYVREIPIILPYDLEGSEFTPKAVFPCSDNSVIIVGEIRTILDIINLFSFCIIKLDAQGNVIWQRFGLFEDTIPLNVVGINIDEDNSVFYLAQRINSYAIFKIDTNGNSTMVSSSWIYDMYVYRFNRAIRLENDEIIAVGRHYGPNPYNPGNVNCCGFVRMRASGEAIVASMYPPGNNNTNAGANAYDMELDSDGCPVAVCQIDYNVVSLVKFDLDGNILQRNDWDGASIQSAQYRISKKPREEYLLLSFKTATGNRIVRFANNNFEDILPIQINGSYTSFLEYYDGLLIAGKEHNGGIASLRSYSLAGESNWQWIYDYAFWSVDELNISPEKLAICPDSCIVFIAGRNSTVNVAKILPNGQITQNDDELVYPVQTDVTLYPNPMKHSLNIEVTGNKAMRTSEKVKIYNIKGQCVRSISLHLKADNKYSAVWDGKDMQGMDCGTGVYLITFADEQTKIAKKVYLVK
jgi:hypothetical protein